MITHENLISLITSTFNVKQSDIAKALGIHPSFITKFKRGRRLPFENTVIYQKVFAPGSIVSGDDSAKYLLNLLKETILEVFPNIEEDMKDCWDTSNYEDFVMTILKRTFPGRKGKVMISSQPDGAQGCSEPSSSNDDGSFEPDRSAIIAVDSEYRVCLCCKNWDENSNFVINWLEKSKSGVKKCRVHNEFRRATDGAQCEFYDASLSRIMIAKSFNVKGLLKN